jgi:hypothetical protein
VIGREDGFDRLDRFDKLDFIHATHIYENITLTSVK